jgi:hypothetical protein
MQLRSDLFPKTAKVFTVSELTRQIRGALVICHSERSREWSGWEAATWTGRPEAERTGVSESNLLTPTRKYQEMSRLCST